MTAILLAVLLAGAGLLTMAAGSPTRQALDAQLQRAVVPARAAAHRERPGTAVSARGGVAVWRSGRYRVSVRLTPNLPAAHNRLVVAVLRDGRPVAGATVAMSFSMPQMDMWSGLRSTLGTASTGRGGITLPVLGMPGVWQLHVAVSPPDGPSFAASVADALVN